MSRSPAARAALPLEAVPAVQSFPENTRGIDYVVGDIHGCYALLDHLLGVVAFRPSQDRLFCVGDLIDRGPQSDHVDAFLARPAVYAVRGNHEEDLLALYEYDPERVYTHPLPQIPPHLLEQFLAPSAAEWWIATPVDRRYAILKALRGLPYAITVATPEGPVGILHSELREGVPWETWCQELRERRTQTIAQTLWGRTRITSGSCTPVPGVSHVWCGHSVRAEITPQGNVWYLDTGAGFPGGKLSVARLRRETPPV